MSDSRFHLKVEFEVYGKKFEWNPSLNWQGSPSECDQRITDWFVECYESALDEHIEKLRIDGQNK